MEQCHELSKELQIRDRVVVTLPPEKNHMDRGCQCDIPKVEIQSPRIPERRAVSNINDMIIPRNHYNNKKCQCDLMEMEQDIKI
jgi:hypothetical protein